MWQNDPELINWYSTPLSEAAQVCPSKNGAAIPLSESLKCNVEHGNEENPDKARAEHPRKHRRAQREDEPHIARARDLAHAYHYLSYYSRAYGTPADAPPALIASLRASIEELGGDPDAVTI